MILRNLAQGAALLTALFGCTTLAQRPPTLPDLQIDDENSIKEIAATIAFDTMSFYNENQTGQTPGKLPETWWEGGFLFNMLIQYWYYTGDTSYNPTTTQGMIHQAGANWDYMPANWTSYLGNDDQVFWGLAAMTAAETNYPEDDNQPASWLALAQGVFNTQAERWDDTTCGGGLRWQLNVYQGGYTLKNAVSNGGFFQLAARLALYTGNQSYADWAVKMWDWSAASPLIDEQTWNIADSATTTDNCTSQGNLQWTYNYGIYILGSAYLYNFTNGSDLWGNRVTNLLQTTFKNFLHDGILAEPACDINMKCNRDQNCFKGLVSHWFAWTTYLMPSTAASIVPVLSASGPGAVKQCSGGAGGPPPGTVNPWNTTSNGRVCGLRWWQASWDGTWGIEQSASALSIVTVQMLGKTGGPPKNARTGATSKSNPAAGGGEGSSDPGSISLRTITGGDKAGAAILTLLVLGAVLGGGAWLVWP